MVSQKKKIACLTGTRADFGFATPIMQAIKQSSQLEMVVFATGMHLMPEFGQTIKEVEKLFPETIKIEARFTSDKPEAQALFAGQLIKELSLVLKERQVDFMLLLGDRVETLATALACLYLGMPTGHFHGGDKTRTADEPARHAITKLASLHFPATQEAAERIKKMGEDPSRIHMVGAPALDVILNQELPVSKSVLHKIKKLICDLFIS